MMHTGEFCSFLFQLFNNDFLYFFLISFFIIFQTVGFPPKNYSVTILLIWLSYPPSLHRQQL